MTLISLEEAKLYLRVDSADEDALTSSLLSAAARLCIDVRDAPAGTGQTDQGQKSPQRCPPALRQDQVR